VLIASGVLLILAPFAALVTYNWPTNRAQRAKHFVRSVSEEQKSALTNASVRFFPGDLGGFPGIFVRFRDIERMCQALNVYVLTKLENEDAPTELVVRPNVPEDPSLAPFQVRVLANFYQPDAKAKTIKLLREIVLPVVRRNINVYDIGDSGGNRQEPGDENEFHIFVCATPDSAERTLVREPVFGIDIITRLHGYVRALLPSGVGIPLTDPDTGFVYGELCGKSLYLLYEALPHTPEKMIALARLLENAAPELDTDTPIEEVLAQIPRQDFPPLGRRKVTQYGFMAHRRDTAVRLVREILLPALREDACIRDCHGLIQKRADDGAFHILYNVRPANFARNSVLPTGRGVPLTTDGGELVAELFDNNLYIYSDALGHGRRADIVRFAEVLLIARRQVLVGRAFNGPLMTVEQFAGECLKLVAEAAPLDPAVTEVRREQTETRFAETLKAARKTEQEIVQLDAFPAELLGREYDSLLRIKKVKDVQVTGTEMIVDTHMLYCTEKQSGVTYRIGEFKIHIPLSGSEQLLFLNQTQLINTSSGRMHAPHVSSGGNACLGSTQDMFPELIRKREFASVVNLAILFLESVNVDDHWGKQITNWPIESGYLNAVGARLTRPF